MSDRPGEGGSFWRTRRISCPTSRFWYNGADENIVGL